MKIVSWNINGIRAIIKKDFIKIITEINPDILCLQETKAQKHEVKKALNPILNSFKIFVNEAEKKGYSGTALLTKLEPLQVTYGINNTEFDQEGRVICAEYIDYFLVTVYTPNAGQGLKRLDFKHKWNIAFKDYVQNLDSIKPVIICGDLNVAHQSIDLKNDKSNYNKTAGYTQIEIDDFSELLEVGFVDVFRYLNPDKIEYTFWSYRFKARERNTGWRIDYFLVSKRIIHRVKDVKILNQYFGSDHCPVLLEIN
jgi:exodeoxyribonuclease-3